MAPQSLVQGGIIFIDIYIYLYLYLYINICTYKKMHIDRLIQGLASNVDENIYIYISSVA